MDHKKIQSILQDALEEEIPSSEIKLWPVIRASLVAGKNNFVQQGERMNAIRPRRIQRVVFAVLMIAALMAVALITPQGRALAQDILKFFRRAESNVILLSPDQIVSPEEAQVVPTAAPPAPLMTISHAYQVVGFG